MHSKTHSMISVLIQIRNKYANTGFKLINNYFEKAEEIVRLELLQELDETYKSIIEDW